MINRSRLGFKEVGSVFSRSRFSSLFFPFFLFTVSINYLGQDVNSILIKFVEAKWRGVFQSQLGQHRNMGAAWWGAELCSLSD